MPHDKRPEFMFAPQGYRPEWQHAPRVSGIKHGAFDEPLWRRVQRVIFWSIVGFAVTVFCAIPFFGA